MSHEKFRHRLEHKKTKDFEKAEKLKSIKNSLENEFKNYCNLEPKKVTIIIDPKKLKTEYNNILFKNISKQRIVEELKTLINVEKSIKRSKSVTLIEEKDQEKRLNEIQSEIDELEIQMIKELQEKQQLLSMKQKVKGVLV